jgi:hypothetical protein
MALSRLTPKSAGGAAIDRMVRFATTRKDQPRGCSLLTASGSNITGSAGEDDITICTGESGHDHAERGTVAREGLSTPTPAQHRPCYFSLGLRKSRLAISNTRPRSAP